MSVTHRATAGLGDADPPADPRAGRAPAASGPTADDGASSLLLAFARLAKTPPPGHLPRRVDELIRSGVLARRHLGALAVIALEGPLTVSELAAHQRLAVSTASLLVTQLADAGLVERLADPADRRRALVAVAPEHRAESRAILASRLAPLRRALRRMGPERAAALHEGLAVVAEEIDRTDGPGFEEG
jgi:DNA-binding MarR family transcriptional regulator